MIEKDIRVNNEFYVCPVFNQQSKIKKRFVPLIFLRCGDWVHQKI